MWCEKDGGVGILATLLPLNRVVASQVSVGVSSERWTRSRCQIFTFILVT